MSAPFTTIRNTPNKSRRQDVARRGVVLHHAAMTSLSGLRNLAMGAKEVSADAIVKDGVAERLVPDGYRAWSLADAYFDSAFRSVETANDSVDGWTVSDASHWTLARLVAYWARTDGFYPHRNGDPKTWTVIGHREVYTIHGASYATACPGGLNIELVVKRAQQLLGSTPAEEDDMFTPADAKRLERIEAAITPGKAGVKDVGVLYGAVLGVPARTVAMLDQKALTKAVVDAVRQVGGADADAVAKRTVELLSERLGG